MLHPQTRSHTATLPPLPHKRLPPCRGHLPGDAGVATSKPGRGRLGLAAAPQPWHTVGCVVHGPGRLVSLLLQAPFPRAPWLCHPTASGAAWYQAGMHTGLMLERGKAVGNVQ